MTHTAQTIDLTNPAQAARLTSSMFNHALNLIAKHTTKLHEQETYLPTYGAVYADNMRTFFRQLEKAREAVTRIYLDNLTEENAQNCVSVYFAHYLISSTVKSRIAERENTFKAPNGADAYIDFMQWLQRTLRDTVCSLPLPTNSDDYLSKAAQAIHDLVSALPRISEDMTSFCYFESLEKMLVGKIKKCTIGRALADFGFNDEVCRIVSDKFATYLEATPPVLHMLENPKQPAQWTIAYSSRAELNGNFCSCMRDSNSVRIYAHPDNNLQLAYLTHDNQPLELGGKLIARTIINQRLRTFVRLYGTHENMRALQHLLTQEGYTEDRYSLQGEPLIRIEQDGRFVCPYIDGIGNISDMGDRLQVGGDIDADNTCGLSGYAQHGTQCQRCGDFYNDEDEGGYVEDEGSTCDYCLSRYYTYSELSDRYIENSEVVEYINRRGYTCNYAGESELEDDGDFIRLDVQHEGCTWCHIDHATYSELTEEWYYTDDTVSLSYSHYGDGAYVHTDEDTVEDMEGDLIRTEDAVLLSPKWYGEDSYVHKDMDTVEDHNGEIILEFDAEEIEGKYYHTSDSARLEASIDAQAQAMKDAA